MYETHKTVYGLCTRHTIPSMVCVRDIQDRLWFVYETHKTVYGLCTRHTRPSMVCVRDTQDRLWFVYETHKTVYGLCTRHTRPSMVCDTNTYAHYVCKQRRFVVANQKPRLKTSTVRVDLASYFLVWAKRKSWRYT